MRRVSITMPFRSILFVLTLHFLNLSTAEDLQGITQEQCEAFGDHVYYNLESGHCVRKFHSGINVPASLFRNNTIHCPSNSTLRWFQPPRGGESQGFCMCFSDLVVSSDYKSCVREILQGELCGEDAISVCKENTGLECSAVGKCECKHAGADWNSTESLCYSDEDCQERASNSYYDKDAGKCYLLINGAAFCDIYAEKGQWNSNGRIKCPPNSQCVYARSSNGRPETICECVRGYGPERNSMQKCVKTKMHQEACATVKAENWEAQDQCDADQGLACSKGICTCAFNTKWEALSDGCRSTTGSSCVSFDSTPAHRRCGRNANCVHRQYLADCECKTGFQSVNGFCYANYKSKCSIDADCLEGMSCIDEICRCENPLSQKVAQDMMSCVNLARSPCSTNSTLTRLATCVNGTTTCSRDSVESISRECLLSFNKECGGELGRCNFEEGLACIRGNCKCLDVQLTYVVGVGCTAKVEGRCGNVYPDYNIKCASDATCVQVTNSVSQCLASHQ